MANLDTRSKRASSVQIISASLLAPPSPDGSFNQGDRQHIAMTYAGILAGGFVPPPPSTVVSEWLIRARRRGRR